MLIKRFCEFPPQSREEDKRDNQKLEPLILSNLAPKTQCPSRIKIIICILNDTLIIDKYPMHKVDIVK